MNLPEIHKIASIVIYWAYGLMANIWLPTVFRLSPEA